MLWLPPTSMSPRHTPPSAGAPESDTVLRAESTHSEKTHVSPEGRRSRNEAVGSAFTGTERALTPAGIPVRNVARPVIKLAYKTYSLSAHEGVHERDTQHWVESPTRP